jgi:hypothetical protein
MTLQQFLEAARELVQDGWFVDNPNGSDVNEEINKLISIVEIQAKCIEIYADGTDYYDRPEEAQECLQAITKLLEERE